MASGVEMLGQMSETEALAGPVQGGNMVVKPNEVPVGGAAMLAKAMRGQANKGVGGIYELPSQEPKEPQFMKVAMENLRNQMAELSPGQGGMKNYLGIQPLAKDAPRYWQSSPDSPPTELAYITDQEKELLLQANLHDSLGAGVPNQGPDGIMSLDGMGIGDEAYDQAVDQSGSEAAIDNYYSSGGGNNNNNQNETAQDIINQVAQYQADTGTNVGGNILQNQQNQQAAIDSILAGGNVQTGIDTDGKANLANDPKKVKQNIKQQEQKRKAETELREAEKSGDSNLIKKAKSKLDKIFDAIKKQTASLFEREGSYSDTEKESRIKELKKKYPGLSDEQFNRLFIDPGANPTMMGAIGDFLSKPKPDKMTNENYMAIMEDARKLGGVKGMSNTGGGIDDFWMDQYSYEHGPIMAEGLKDLPPSERNKILSGTQGFKEYMETMSSGLKGKEEYQGSEAQRRADKADYYSGNMPGTMGGLETLAGETTFSNADMAKMKPEQVGKAKAFNQKVFNAREQYSRGKGNNQQNNRPQFMDRIQEEVIDTPDGVVDEESQTMKYTSPRTGGTETSVPLQRRFRTDPTQEVAQYNTTPRTEADILKYATQGTTGEGIGLEPFSEYQRRRRKALGLEELGLFN